jgi:CO dehydrogenase maturation factor
MKPLNGKRILVCGKGGSGKSSTITLLAHFLELRDYNVILLDGDASNPGGLKRLIAGDTEAPRPLIDYFGGREKVTCPVDDPSPLLRVDTASPVIELHLNPEEIPTEYYIRDNNIRLFQVGKIEQPNEGCDGPMSKVSRDFIVEGPYVTLIDMEAGIEHFGRGIEKNVDVVLVIVDPTFESFEIAHRVNELSRKMGINHVFAILNSVKDNEMERVMRKKLTEKNVEHLGTLKYDEEIFKAGLEGNILNSHNASKQTGYMVNLINKLESLI